MSHPRYQDLGAAQIPEVRRDDGTVIRVVAGEVDGVGGAVTEIYAEPEYLDVTLPAGAHFAQPVPRGHSALVYAFEGEGIFGVGRRPRVSRRPRRRAALRRRRWPSSATATWCASRPTARRCAFCS